MHLTMFTAVQKNPDACHPFKHTHTHTRFPGLPRVSRYQKGKTNLDFTESRDSEWQWHQLGHMQICTLLQTDNHTSTPPLSYFTGRMPFLPPNQQRQSTEAITPNRAKYQQQFLALKIVKYSVRSTQPCILQGR